MAVRWLQSTSTLPAHHMAKEHPKFSCDPSPLALLVVWFDRQELEKVVR